MASLFSTPKLPAPPPVQRMPIEQSRETEQAARARREAEALRLRGGGRAETELARTGGGRVLGS